MPAEEQIFKEYEEVISRIDKEAFEAREKARITLREQLKALRDTAHEELKAIRIISQKTKERRRND